jgi:hypothetical protein
MPENRVHDVTALTAAELERIRRDLQASFALARPGSPASVPILAHLTAIDAELAARTAGRTLALCSCGFATDDPNWLDGHLFQHPGYHERPQPPDSPLARRSLAGSESIGYRNGLRLL